MADTFNARGLVDQFGGVRSFIKKCQDYGFEYNIKTVEKWIERSSVPAGRLFEIQKVIEAENMDCCVLDFG